jgi:hypothetical protein
LPSIILNEIPGSTNKIISKITQDAEAFPFELGRFDSQESVGLVYLCVWSNIRISWRSL